MPDTTHAERPEPSREGEPGELTELPPRGAEPGEALDAAETHDDMVKGGRLALDSGTTAPSGPIPIPYPNTYR